MDSTASGDDVAFARLAHVLISVLAVAAATLAIDGDVDVLTANSTTSPAIAEIISDVVSGGSSPRAVARASGEGGLTEPRRLGLDSIGITSSPRVFLRQGLLTSAAWCAARMADLGIAADSLVIFASRGS